jgi:hypothetical protein
MANICKGTLVLASPLDGLKKIVRTLSFFASVGYLTINALINHSPTVFSIILIYKYFIVFINMSLHCT